MSQREDTSVGLASTLAIGIGGMVGGGIFAVLGLSVSLAKGGAPVAFALAGGVALITAYAYARLSVAFPSQGGTVEFLNHAFGTGLFTGSMNVLLWLSNVVMLSLYAFAFGSYAASFMPEASQPLWSHLFSSAVVLLLTALNALSANIVGDVEEWIVGIKLAILGLFVAVGLFSVETAKLAPQAWAQPLSLVAGGMVIFVAYEGFELIANTAEDVRDPKKNLPRAYFGAVGFVVLLYVLVSVVTVGNLSVDKISQAKDYALAAAAKPFLGQFGFTLIAVAAMLSTASAISATLYGSMRVSYIIAKDGELPDELERKIWDRPLEGLFISAGATLLVTNLFDLSSISTMGSAGFLFIFAAVNVANARMAEETQSRAWISWVGAALCLGALGTLVWQVATSQPTHLWILAGLAALAVGIEATYRKLSGRKLVAAH
ncbi:APC family permease [Bradymonas sediminis]|uniref:Amino acid transporter n=1 Tax=Bradymonas sediminis TaxID=1548548 RepID=A0A2Z4FM15_9DELT|nr:APC family permease [Bradymonas sediminis]AWV90047.1 amino acid transporter [Bradymonas sediminis]TDP75994.1 amino acid:proton symporter (ABT family) [Bradymonas sediminis]